MKLAVISPESHDSREIAVVHALFGAGLERYHLRKPHWSAAEVEAWLDDFSSTERARIVAHSHPALVERWGLAGAHERDDGKIVEQRWATPGLTSRAIHDLDTLCLALDRYDAVLLSPIFASISKPGYGPSGQIDFNQLSRLLANRTIEQRRTIVFALGGVDQNTARECHRLGFDGIAVLGAIWNSNDPVDTFKRLFRLCRSLGSRTEPIAVNSQRATPFSHNSILSRHPIMCLTQDGLALSHIEQATRLCAAGARWIQLRMKAAAPAEWLSTARTVAAICREHGAVFIVNDSVEIALEADADGVHLGKGDLGWAEARRRLGPGRILGGTINNSEDAANARTVGYLDYVGVGPWRFTSNKKNLAPVLGAEGVRRLILELDGLPAWAIGGIETSDLPAVHSTGAVGVAVSSALYRGGDLENNFRAFNAAWPIHLEGEGRLPLRNREVVKFAMPVTIL